MDILKVLDNLNIKYNLAEHEAVYTCEQAQIVKSLIKGTGCKNLFLYNKTDYYLIVLPDDKKADMKVIAKQIGSKRLSFCSEQKLRDILKLKPGSVTPLGIINDTENVVTLVIDSELKGSTLLFHPNTNNKTISICFDDFIKFIEAQKHRYIFI